MARRVVGVIGWGLGGSVVGCTVGGSAAYLHHHDWQVGSTGVVRFGRAVVAAAGVVIDYKRSLRNMDPSSPEYAKIKSQVHRRSAERLRAMCCVNRGCFIKVGQHIGALEYLLPVEYVQTFKVLHSDAPQSPLSELEQVFREEIGKEISEVFSYFDEKPCGTASLAQVHRARLHDGSDVAVKIQHPQVKEHSHTDMKTMEFLINVVSRIFPDFQFGWLAEETKRNLPLELDFYHEAGNCERVAKMFKHFHFLKVPEVYWNLTTSRVLTMEFCEGGQINDKKYFIKHNIDINKVSRMLGRLYSEMIFVKGYVHSDPHPGNVLVSKSEKAGTQIVLLDHGLYASLTDKFRLSYCGLWRSLICADQKGIEKHSLELGIGQLYPLFACMVTARTWNNVVSGIDKVPSSAAEDDEIKENVGLYLPEISAILNSVPREMLLIFKTNDLLRGIEQTLSTRADARSFITMSRCCVRATYAHKVLSADSWLRRAQLAVVEQLELLRISAYELFLWLASSSLARALQALQKSTEDGLKLPLPEQKL